MARFAQLPARAAASRADRTVSCTWTMNGIKRVGRCDRDLTGACGAHASGHSACTASNGIRMACVVNWPGISADLGNPCQQALQHALPILASGWHGSSAELQGTTVEFMLAGLPSSHCQYWHQDGVCSPAVPVGVQQMLMGYMSAGYARTASNGIRMTCFAWHTMGFSRLLWVTRQWALLPTLPAMASGWRVTQFPPHFVSFIFHVCVVTAYGVCGWH
jgi:hypothetical protein